MTKIIQVIWFSMCCGVYVVTRICCIQFTELVPDIFTWSTLSLHLQFQFHLYIHAPVRNWFHSGVCKLNNLKIGDRVSHLHHILSNLGKQRSKINMKSVICAEMLSCEYFCRPIIYVNFTLPTHWSFFSSFPLTFGVKEKFSKTYYHVFEWP
jgi:hypothetical protein